MCLDQEEEQEVVQLHQHHLCKMSLQLFLLHLRSLSYVFPGSGFETNVEQLWDRCRTVICIARAVALWPLAWWNFHLRPPLSGASGVASIVAVTSLMICSRPPPPSLPWTPANLGSHRHKTHTNTNTHTHIHTYTYITLLWLHCMASCGVFLSKGMRWNGIAPFGQPVEEEWQKNSLLSVPQKLVSN